VGIGGGYPRTISSKIDANWVELMEILDKEIVQWKEKGEKLLDVS
jgi:hypothetical protein